MSTTANFGWEYPDPFSATYEDLWGYVLNTLIVNIDSEFVLRTADYNFADYILSRPILKDYGEILSSPSSTAGAITLDIANGNHFKTTLSENITTVTISNPTATGKLCAFSWEIKQGASPYTVTFPASVKWPITPNISLTSSRSDIFIFRSTDAGTTWAPAIYGQNYAGL